MNRRALLKYSLATGATLAFGGANSNVAMGASPAQEKRKFRLDLCGGRVGIKTNQSGLIDLAQKNGFESVEPLEWELGKLDAAKLEIINDQRKAAKLEWSAGGLSVDFRRSEEKFKKEMEGFPALCKSLQAAGVTRLGTWIMPAHDSMTYMKNFKQHASRIKEIAKVLQQHQLRIGLEYVGTKTLWTSKRFPFVHTLRETLELIEAIGEDNVGLTLDSWHWTMAGESAEDISKLSNEQIVACDLNDAPAGIDVDDQLDNQRELPMATGVIDTKAFLEALVKIGYDGPIRAEPFNKKLNEMDNEAAATATGDALKKAMELVGG